MTARWGPLVVLLALALGTGWLVRELELEPEAEAARTLPHTRDFYMEDFISTTMDPSGAPKRRLQARYMEHFPDTDSSNFVSPYLVLYRSQGQPWHVRSERGWSSANGEVLLLFGAVHIWRDDASGEREIDIHTRDLRVIPETEYGETEHGVVIRTRSTESHGVGMRAHLAQSRLELLRDVRTVYWPEEAAGAGSGIGPQRAPAARARTPANIDGGD